MKLLILIIVQTLHFLLFDITKNEISFSECLTVKHLTYPLQPQRTLQSSLEYALFYTILHFVQGTTGFGHVIALGTS